MSTTGKPTSEDTEDEIAENDAVEDAVIVDEIPPEEPAGDDATETATEEVEESAKEVEDVEDADQDILAAAPELESEAPTVEAVSETPVPPPVEVPRIRRGPGFFTMLVGGLIAGAIGYVLAYATEFQPLPQLFGHPDLAAEIGVLKGADATQDGRLDSVEMAAGAASDAAAAAADQARVASKAAADASAAASAVADGLGAMDTRVTELTPGADDVPPAILEALRTAALDKVNALAERVAASEAQLGALQQSLAAATGQIEALGGVQAGATGQQLSAYEVQLAALQTELDNQREAIAASQIRAEEMNAAAQAQQRKVLAEAALARVRAAVTGGGVFAGPLAELTATSGADIPPALSNVADGGVKTLPQLQETFPTAARAGLDAAIAAEAGEGTTMERLGNFLRTQSGARSLSEREGDDPDAVLSRVAARLSEGDLATALAELETLNEAGRGAMAGWIAAAEARAAAEAAVAELSAALAAE